MKELVVLYRKQLNKRMHYGAEKVDSPEMFLVNLMNGRYDKVLCVLDDTAEAFTIETVPRDSTGFVWICRTRTRVSTGRGDRAAIARLVQDSFASAGKVQNYALYRVNELLYTKQQELFDTMSRIRFVHTELRSKPEQSQYFDKVFNNMEKAFRDAGFELGTFLSRRSEIYLK